MRSRNANRNLIVFAFAATGSLLRQIPLIHYISEQRRVGAIGEADQIVEALRRGGVNVGEGRKGRRHFRTLQVLLV
jgi:hypothetical protein